MPYHAVIPSSMPPHKVAGYSAAGLALQRCPQMVRIARTHNHPPSRKDTSHVACLPRRAAKALETYIKTTREAPS